MEIDADAVHQRAARGEINSAEAIRILSDRALNQDINKIDTATIEAARRGPDRTCRALTSFFLATARGIRIRQFFLAVHFARQARTLGVQVG
jgi:hypothetical protein